MSTWIEVNLNPVANRTGDCAIRAVAAALDVDWDTASDMIYDRAKAMGEIMQADAAWGSVLRSHGFNRYAVPNTCPDCYTAEDFCRDHPKGIFVLGFGTHVATVVDGAIWDTWDSSQLIPVYYWH